MGVSCRYGFKIFSLLRLKFCHNSCCMLLIFLTPLQDPQSLVIFFNQRQVCVRIDRFDHRPIHVIRSQGLNRLYILTDIEDRICIMVKRLNQTVDDKIRPSSLAMLIKTMSSPLICLRCPNDVFPFHLLREMVLKSFIIAAAALTLVEPTLYMALPETTTTWMASLT